VGFPLQEGQVLALAECQLIVFLSLCYGSYLMIKEDTLMINKLSINSYHIKKNLINHVP